MYFVIRFSSWQSDCVLLFFFFNLNSNHLIYPGVLQSAQFCLFWMAVLAYRAYSKIAKSSPPMNGTLPISTQERERERGGGGLIKVFILPMFVIENYEQASR